MASGFAILLFGLMIALSGFLKSSMVESGAQLEELIKELVVIDSSYEYLLQSSYEEMASFLLGTVNAIAIFMVIMGIIGITLGVLDFILAKKYKEIMQGKLGKKIALTVVSFVFYWEFVSNIIRTVALFLKDEKNENTVIIE